MKSRYRILPSIRHSHRQLWKVVSNQETLETNIPGVYVIGDANLGPATIVEAIADATKAANNICLVHNHHYEKII